MNPLRAAEAGMTMTEVMVMTLIISTLMIIMTEAMSTLSGVRVEQRAHFRIGDVGDRVGRRIENDLGYAARLFSDTSDDLDYLRSLAIGSELLAQGRRLPKLTQSSYFRSDPPGIAETGNILFVARRGPRVKLQFESGGSRLVQGLQFVVYCPVDAKGTIDLIRWISESVVDYWDITGIQDLEQRTEALQQLQNNGVRLAWDPHAPRSTGLYEIGRTGLQPLPVEDLINGAEDRVNSRPFASHRMQIAPNDSVPGVAVPAYAQASSGFSGGFEIKVDGSENGKLVLLRFVIVSTEVLKRPIWTEIHRFLNTNG